MEHEIYDDQHLSRIIDSALLFELQNSGPMLLVAVIALDANLSSGLVSRDAAELIAHRMRNEAVTKIHRSMDTLPKQDVALLEAREVSHPLKSELSEFLAHVASVVGGSGIPAGIPQSRDDERGAIVVAELPPAINSLGVAVRVVCVWSSLPFGNGHGFLSG